MKRRSLDTTSSILFFELLDDLSNLTGRKIKGAVARSDFRTLSRCLTRLRIKFVHISRAVSLPVTLPQTRNPSATTTAIGTSGTKHLIKIVRSCDVGSPRNFPGGFFPAVLTLPQRFQSINCFHTTPFREIIDCCRSRGW